MEKPSINLLNSSVVMLLASCAVPGHWKHPSASRIYRRMNLSPVQRSPLIRSRLVPQNKNKVSFSNGSRPYFNLTMAASPSIPLRRSDLPVARMSFEKVKPFSVSIFQHPQYHGKLFFIYTVIEIYGEASTPDADGRASATGPDRFPAPLSCHFRRGILCRGKFNKTRFIIRWDR